MLTKSINMTSLLQTKFSLSGVRLWKYLFLILPDDYIIGPVMAVALI